MCSSHSLFYRRFPPRCGCRWVCLRPEGHPCRVVKVW
ncbi:MAG: hypothetical protein EBT60_03170 [Bacteroidetes bacterium]|nr:hypothetical protein [Bacteroidota bacterium]